MRVVPAIVATAVAVVVAGCASPHPLKSRFDPHEVSFAAGSGTNTIAGDGFVRTRTGEIRHCGGLEVSLVPDSTYARERLNTIYGNTIEGYRNVSDTGVRFSHNDPRYFASHRVSRCDAKGHFRFERVPDGTYYVITSVHFSDPYSHRSGGTLMRRVIVAGGTTKTVLLAP